MAQYNNGIASLLIVEDAAKKTRVQPLIKDNYSMGRRDGENGADILLSSDIVSNQHGMIFQKNGNWYYQDWHSTNGIFLDGRHIIGTSKPEILTDGMVLRIDGDRYFSQRYLSKGVLMVFCEGDYSNQRWVNYPLNSQRQEKVYIGRDDIECEIGINSFSVSRKHGVFTRRNMSFYYQDFHSTNGTIINGVAIRGDCQLKDKDVLLIGKIKLIYVSGVLLYMEPNSGGHLKIRGLTKRVNDADRMGKKKTILHNVNVDIAASELVAVLGTSGAGKSTFLNCVNGYEEATEGQVLLNEIDLYKNKKIVKKQIGYVPQEDLLRDGLKVISTLKYIAKLRLPKDVGRKERIRAIEEVLEILGLEEKLKNSKIQKLSGGQRKRVSIASELISDPPLLFLDEPTSGLDPETETNLIKQLRELAHRGNKTLIVITHTLKNIHLFDKILFLGPGGKVCYFGSPIGALKEFGVSDIIDIYPMIRENPDIYAKSYSQKFY